VEQMFLFLENNTTDSINEDFENVENNKNLAYFKELLLCKINLKNKKE
jgi:hypothetical protein